MTRDQKRKATILSLLGSVALLVSVMVATLLITSYFEFRFHTPLQPLFDDFRLTGITVALVAFGFCIYLSCVIMLAVIRESFWFVFLPILPASVSFGLLAGIPLALLFFVTSTVLLFFFFRRVQSDLANRITLRLAADIRVPLTRFYLILFFVIACVLIPVGDSFLTATLDFLSHQNNSNASEQANPPPTSELTPQNIIDSEMKTREVACGGDTACVEELEKVVTESVLSQLFSSETRSQKTDEELKNKPLTEVAVNETSRQVLQGMRLPSGFQNSQLPNFIGSLLLFSLLAPFSILFAGISSLFSSAFLQICLLTGFFRLERQTVKRDVVR